jgi:hypothetical protein
MNGLTDQKFIAALTEIHDAGQGAMRLDIVYPDTVLAMLARRRRRCLGRIRSALPAPLPKSAPSPSAYLLSDDWVGTTTILSDRSLLTPSSLPSRVSGFVQSARKPHVRTQRCRRSGAQPETALDLVNGSIGSAVTRASIIDPGR